MKRALIITLCCLLFVFIAYFVWINLPFKILYFKEIGEGNKVALNLNRYYSTEKALPSDTNWTALDKLGFVDGQVGTQPYYKKINEKDYELIYLEGFDGPYLTYKSSTKEWSMTFLDY